MDISAKQITILRKRLGLSQDGFGKKIGFSRSYVRDIETGKAKPSRKILEAISIECRVSIDWILFGDNIKKRAHAFIKLLNKLLVDVDKKKSYSKKKIYDHFQEVDEITEYERSFYIYKLLTLFNERELETKTLLIRFHRPDFQNWIIETPVSYHAFLGNPIKPDQWAKATINYTIVRTHSIFYSITLPSSSEQYENNKILLIKNNKLLHIPSNRYYNIADLFREPETKFGPMLIGPILPHWQRKEKTEEYFAEIDPSQVVVNLYDHERLSDIEKSVVSILRVLDKNSLKDIYLLLSSKGGRLGKGKRDKLKKEITTLKRASK